MSKLLTRFKKNICFLLAVLLTVGLFTVGSGSARAASGSSGTVNSGITSLNVRSGPGTSYNAVTTLSSGTAVTVSDYVSGDTITDGGVKSSVWYEISFTQNSTDYTGYVSAVFLTVTNGYSSRQATVINTTDSVNVRTVPDSSGGSSTLLGSIAAGTTLAVIACAEGESISGNTLWYIVSGSGLIGYVSGYYLSVASIYAGKTGTVTASGVNLRSAPNTSGTSLGTLSSGTSVSILDAADGESISGNTLWYQVTTSSGLTGYITAYYVTLSSTAGGTEEGTGGTGSTDTGGGSSDSGTTSGGTGSGDTSTEPADLESMLAQFPESYRDALTALHEKYPNWVFKPIEVSYTWDYSVSKEYQKDYSLTSLVDPIKWTSVPTSWKCCESWSFDWDTGTWAAPDNGSYAYASYQLIEYYMDPRNFLDSTNVFQFLDMTFDGSTQTVAGVQAILDGTFMAGELPDEPGTTYAECIYEASETYGANPYVIAAKLVQEQGSTGSSMTSGTVTGYEGYYNFFNFNAYGNSSSAIIANAMNYAVRCGWSSRRSAIEGGTKQYVSNYINSGQYTPYLTRFNVAGTSPFTHQYASAIFYAWSEGQSTSSVYSESTRQQALTFSIPVYSDMPSEACERPTGNNSPYLKLKSLSVTGGTISPHFMPDTLEYTITLPAGASSATVSAEAMDPEASVSGAGTLLAGTTQVITVTSRYGTTLKYTVTVVQSTASSTVINAVIDSGRIYASPGSTVSSLTSSLVTNGTAAVYSGGKTKAASALAATGDIIVFYTSDGESLGAFRLIITGDVNQDGSANLKDVSLLFRFITGQEESTDEQLLAGESDGVNGITLRDAAVLYNKIQ